MKIKLTDTYQMVSLTNGTLQFTGPVIKELVVEEILEEEADAEV